MSDVLIQANDILPPELFNIVSEYVVHLYDFFMWYGKMWSNGTIYRVRRYQYHLEKPLLCYFYNTEGFNAWVQRERARSPRIRNCSQLGTLPQPFKWVQNGYMHSVLPVVTMDGQFVFKYACTPRNDSWGFRSYEKELMKPGNIYKSVVSTGKTGNNNWFYVRGKNAEAQYYNLY